MTDTEQKQQINQKRIDSLKALTRYFQKIEFLTLSQTQFSTQDLQELSIFAQYSIHPIYKGKKIYKFYQKLADFYWKAILEQKNQRTEIPENNPSNQQNEQRISIQSHSDYQQSPQINNIQENSFDKNQINEKSEEIKINDNTEAIMQQIQVQKMVSKNYEQIKNFINKFNPQKNIFSDNIDKKIQILNSWNVVSHKLHNFTPKKQSQSIKLSKITSKTYLQDLKTPKNVHKDSFGSSTIILGKNQSTQTKQMKYMLKIQSKKNFVDQKKKQQQNLSVVNKKSIELTYFLNIITKEFFEDFSNQIERLIEENIQIIPIFCEKILAKVKDEHNFIQIYVKLIKKLCKKSNNSDIKGFSGILQKKFVSFFQNKFIELISQNVNYTQQSDQSYVYQKQMIGLCTFIGKLMRQNILSLKIFKVCFWQIVYRFVAKVKQNSQNYITNECLIGGIVLISDSMQEKQLRKIIEKQKINNISEEVSQQAFQKMINALVNPNDQDSSSQGQLYDNLIDSISILEYPSILNGLLQIFQSKRLKLKFLVEAWSQKMKNVQKIPNSQNKINQIIQPTLKNNEIQQKDNTCIALMKQIKELEENISLNDNNVVKLLASLRTRILQQKNSSKLIQHFINEFLNIFADTTKKSVMYKRIEFLFQFYNLFNKDYTKFEQICINLITNNLFEQLMIIQCDFPFLVQGLSHIIFKIMKDLDLRSDQVLQKVKYDKEDEDLQDFYLKLEKSLNLLCKSEED